MLVHGIVFVSKSPQFFIHRLLFPNVLTFFFIADIPAPFPNVTPPQRQDCSSHEDSGVYLTVLGYFLSKTFFSILRTVSIVPSDAQYWSAFGALVLVAWYDLKFNVCPVFRSSYLC